MQLLEEGRHRVTSTTNGNGLEAKPVLLSPDEPQGDHHSKFRSVQWERAASIFSMRT